MLFSDAGVDADAADGPRRESDGIRRDADGMLDS
jgi:hypothetical protein